LVRLDSRSLLEQAADSTGLDDFGPPTFREGLDVLIESAELESGMHEDGRALLASMIRSRLINRLQLYDWHRRHPEIGDEEIPAPVFIIGLWRTGTTILSYLLAQDPASRSLRRWEASIPCPPPGLDRQADEERIARLELQIARQHEVTPELAAINIQEAEGPTECVLTLSQEFKSLLFDCSLHIPAFYEWNRQVDQRSAYDLHRATLQLLQWKQPPNRWQLKAPAHTMSLPALLEVYPDARFVVPHRDPAVSLASACDFWELQMRSFTDKVDTDALGAHWLDVYCDALDRLQVFLDELVDPGRVVELQYPELRDTLGAVTRIYDELEIPMTADAEHRMADFLAHHRPGQHGTHDYSLERYGLDPAEVAARFAPAVERFEIEVRS
jgi:hypothetical protein